MFKKLFIFIFLFLASTSTAKAAVGYKINSFHTDLTLEKNTQIKVIETIKVDFLEPRHGIFRYVPVVYTANLKTININLSDVLVTDEKGQKVPALVRRKGKNTEIKIGDPAKTLTGLQTYKINYRVEDVLQKYDDHLEIYWNVTGDKWNTSIPQPSVSFTSEYANITGAACFTGVVGSNNSNCEVGYEESALISSSKVSSGNGSDFTIVAVVDKNNFLIFPNFFQKLVKNIKDNFGYVIALLPLIYMLFSWYKKGRDITFGNKFYYGETKDLKIKPIFARKHMPTVYAPIEGLAPAQIGTIVDEKVDIQDIVAEIVELARLKYIKITSLPKKRFKNQDYKLEKIKDSDDKLLDYQKYLLDSLFPVASGNEIFTSKFKDIKFYRYLGELKKKIYKSVTKDKYFDRNPNKVRLTWSFKVIIMFVTSLFVIYRLRFSDNSITYVLLAISFPIAAAIAAQMPRKTAKGYAIFQDVKGLKNYLKIGKWRHEIYEKNLFLEEMIPLAISLGVIKKLTNHMKELGIKPESISSNYVAYSGLSSFEKSMSKSMLTGASNSTKSGWSGGSGFSGGGFSGGGFGGGGGGSW